MDTNVASDVSDTVASGQIGVENERVGAAVLPSATLNLQPATKKRLPPNGNLHWLRDMLLFPPSAPSTTTATSTTPPHPTGDQSETTNNKARANGHFSPTKLPYLASSFLSPPSTALSTASSSDCRIPAPTSPPPLPPPVYLSVCLFVFAVSLQKQTASSPVTDTAVERRQAETRCLPARPGMCFKRLTPPFPFCLPVYTAGA